MSNGKPTVKPRNPRKSAEVDLGFSWGLWNTVLLALGVVLLVLGYVSLSKGSTTLAPVLLVAGYCGLIPASLLVRGRSGVSGE